jgi:amphi-Trp domain-containing protein
MPQAQPKRVMARVNDPPTRDDEVDPGDDRAPMKLAFEGSLSLPEAVSYFEGVLSGLKSGTLRFRRGHESITLEPAPHVELEVKASRKGRKEKVSFELRWSSVCEKDLEIG